LSGEIYIEGFMSNLAIRINDLSKQYRIGTQQPRYKTIRETLTNHIAAPLRKVRESLKGHYGKIKADERIWALNNVSFEIRRGEVIGVIGRNGAGKTTLLKILSRITEPTEGRVEIHGSVGALLEVGTGFHPELTGRENIYLNGSIFGMKKREIDKKFDEIVTFAETERFLDTPIKRYSSGMRMRLAFAVAAHLEPEILLVDEVLAVGDVAFQKKCMGKMKDVAKEGRTVLFVSHNMSAINQLCNRCILLDDGKKIVDSTTQKAIETYLSHDGEDSEIYFPINEGIAAQIIKATVLNSEGRATRQIHYQEEFEIVITIKVREKSSFYHTLMFVRDSLNNTVIFTTDKDIVDSALKDMSGQCEYHIRFPAKWLKPDNYHVRLELKRRESGRIFGGDLLSNNEKLPLSFQIIDIESRRSKEQRYGNAAVAPELPWFLSR